MSLAKFCFSFVSIYKGIKLFNNFKNSRKKKNCSRHKKKIIIEILNKKFLTKEFFLTKILSRNGKVKIRNFKYLKERDCWFSKFLKIEILILKIYSGENDFNMMWKVFNFS